MEEKNLRPSEARQRAAEGFMEAMDWSQDCRADSKIAMITIACSKLENDRGLTKTILFNKGPKHWETIGGSQI